MNPFGVEHVAKKASTDAAAAAGGAVAGQGIYQGAGYGAKHINLKRNYEKPPGAKHHKPKKMSRNKFNELLKPVKAKHGPYTAKMLRNFPKEIDGARTTRTLGYTHNGKAGVALGTAATLGGGVVAYNLAHKESKVKLVPAGRTPVAKRVSDAILSCRTDDEAALLTTILVSEALQHDMLVHHDVLQDQINTVVSKQVATLRKNLARATISKQRDGGDITALVSMSEQVIKNFESISKDFDYTDQERARFAQKQGRNALGQFRTSHHKIDYSGGRSPVPAKHAAKLGAPGPPNNLRGPDALALQEAYMQVNGALKPYASLPAGESILHLTYTNANGQSSTVTKDTPTELHQGQLRTTNLLDRGIFATGGRLTAVSVGVNPNLSVQGAAFDLVGALGEEPGIAAARLTERGEGGRQFVGASRLGSFAGEWNSTTTDVNNLGNDRRGIFQRFGHGSRLLQSMAGEHAPERVKLALQAGEFVSQYGQEAEKVIGPHADRIAYRYRGVERKPDAALQANIDAYRGRYPDNTAARNALIYGSVSEHVNRQGVRSETQASPIIEYFRGRLADKDLIQLQSQSGVIPPSEGMIIDRKGKVVTQAVGYGDDWYLPFNLKTLSQVKGGEYIRTRAWGGPTTEDIYAGLVSGARAVTVISHNGVYTIEFDESFRGTRRYNDKAARMVKRYGHLLDAVKSKQVTLTGIPEDRLLELKSEAARRYDPKVDRSRYNDKFEQLKKDERLEPQMSQAFKAQLATDFLDEQAANLPVKHGADQAPDWTDFATNYVANAVAQSEKNHPTYPGAPEFDPSYAREAAANNVRTPLQVISVAGLDVQWQKFLANKEVEYKAEQSPLNLDGPGYDKSMKALREQFPYYISNTSWQPNRIHGTDVGYIKPKHNRPEGALSGYFDTTITGTGKQLSLTGTPTGKITADQTRYQNGRTPDRIEARGGSQRRENPPGAPGSPGSPSGPDSPYGSPTPEIVALQGQQVVGQLWDYYHQREVYDLGPNAGTRVAPEGARTRMPLLFGDKDTLEAAYAENPSSIKTRLLTEISHANDLFYPPTHLVNELRDPVRAQVGGPYTTVAGLATPNKNFDFGPDFAPGREPELYKATANDLLRQLRIDQHDVGSVEAAALVDEVLARNKGVLQRAVNNPALGEDVPRANEEIKMAVQYKQAVRRMERAREQEAEAAAARAARDAQSAPSPGTITVNVPGFAPQTAQYTQPMTNPTDFNVNEWNARL